MTDDRRPRATCRSRLAARPTLVPVLMVAVVTVALLALTVLTVLRSPSTPDRPRHRTPAPAPAGAPARPHALDVSAILIRQPPNDPGT